MKSFFSPVARVCTEIVEMTGNIARGGWRRTTVAADKAIGKNTLTGANNRSNYVPRRQAALRQSPLSEACAMAAESAIEHPAGLEFDVGRFCSELEEWRAAMAALASDKLSASLESNVADAVRRLEGGSIFDGIDRVSR